MYINNCTGQTYVQVTLNAPVLVRSPKLRGDKPYSGYDMGDSLVWNSIYCSSVSFIYLFFVKWHIKFVGYLIPKLSL